MIINLENSQSKASKNRSRNMVDAENAAYKYENDAVAKHKC